MFKDFVSGKKNKNIERCILTNEKNENHIKENLGYNYKQKQRKI